MFVLALKLLQIYIYLTVSHFAWGVLSGVLYVPHYPTVLLREHSSTVFRFYSHLLFCFVLMTLFTNELYFLYVLCLLLRSAATFFTLSLASGGLGASKPV